MLEGRDEGEEQGSKREIFSFSTGGKGWQQNIDT